MSCAAELCPNWTGQGCICEVLGLEPPAEAEEEGEFQCERCGGYFEAPEENSLCPDCEAA